MAKITATAELTNKLAFGFLTFTKEVVGGNQGGSFTFDVKIGTATADTPYKGAYDIANADKVCTDGSISGVANGTKVTMLVPKGMRYAIAERPADGFITVYDKNETGTVGTTSATTVKNLLNNSKINVTKIWNDNNSSSRPSDAALKAALKIYFTIEGGAETLLTEGTMAQIGLNAMPGMDINKQSYSNWSCVFKNGKTDIFPSVSADGKAITYAVKETDMEGYISTVDSVSGAITNTKAEPFNGSILWRDTSKTKPRPKVALTLYAYTTDVTKAEKVENPAIQFTEDGDTTAFAISNLPQFDEDGNVIVYYVQEDSLSADNKTGYKIGYDNGTGSYANITTQVYHGGVIINTLIDVVPFSADKIWLDDKTPETIAKRPTGTLHLWRYPVGGSVETAFPVIVFDASVPNSHGTVLKQPLDNTQDYTFSFPDLAQYDENGKEYVYFVREILEESKDYVSSCENQTPNQDNTEVVFQDGILKNAKVESAKFSVTKQWITAAYPDYIKQQGASVTLQVYRKAEGETNFEEVEGSKFEIKDFNAEALTKTVTEEWPKYDAEGKLYTYQVRESEIKVGGEPVKIESDGTFTINGKQYKRTDSKEFQAGEEGIVTNALYGLVNCVVIKKWEGITPDAGATVTAVLQRKAYNGNWEDVAENGVPVSCTLTAQNNWKHTFENYPEYDALGYQYSYRVKEGTVTGVSTAFQSEATYENDIENRVYTTTITNKPVGDGGRKVEITKEWKDDGDVMHRLPVLVGLYKKGENTPKATATLAASSNWTAKIAVPDDIADSEIVVKEIALVDGATEYPVHYEASENNWPAGFEAFYLTRPDVKNIVRTGTDGHYYKVEIDKNAEGVYVITNTRISTVNYDVTKKWMDGIPTSRPTLTLTLTGGGVAETFVMKAGENGFDLNQKEWKHTFANLRKYDTDGVLIPYQVKETMDANGEYETAVTQGAYIVGDYHSMDTQSTIITNKREGLTDFVVHKKWKDVDGTTTRPDIRIVLYQRIGTSGELTPYEGKEPRFGRMRKKPKQSLTANARLKA